MTNLCVEIDPYTNRVLGVIKEKYGLKDKGQAINKFAELHGDDFVEKEASEDAIAEAIAIGRRHLKKYGIRKMKDKELDALFGA